MPRNGDGAPALTAGDLIMSLGRVRSAAFAVLAVLHAGAAGAAPEAGSSPERPPERAPERIVLAMSGWAGFAPLALAEHAGFFERRGVRVELRLMPQHERWAAMRAGTAQAVAGTLDALVVGAAQHGLTWPHVLVLDRSVGGDGIAAGGAVESIAALRGRSVAVDRPGTTPFFLLACALRRAGLAPSDLHLVPLAPRPAAAALLAGQYDGAVTAEPYLSQLREVPGRVQVLVTTHELPVVLDSLALAPALVARRPAVAQALVDGVFEALEAIRAEPERAAAIIAQRLHQAPESFVAAARTLRWIDRAENRAWFAGPMERFLRDAADILRASAAIDTVPELALLADARFVGVPGGAPGGAPGPTPSPR
jgi:NitT/TauT family transport system substrate-binding protein